MATPVSDRSKALSSLLGRWWQLRTERKTTPTKVHLTRLGSLHRFCIQIGWRRLGAIVDGEMVNVKEQRDKEVKENSVYPRKPGGKIDWLAVAHGADPNYPDVWPGGGPIHPDDR